MDLFAAYRHRADAGELLVAIGARAKSYPYPKWSNIFHLPLLLIHRPQPSMICSGIFLGSPCPQQTPFNHEEARICLKERSHTGKDRR